LDNCSRGCDAPAALFTLWGSFPVAQLYRYARVSDATQRQQIKWVVFGIAVAVAGAFMTIFTVGAAIDLPKEDVGPKMLSMLLMDAFVLFIPLSIGVAVLRARLIDIDVIINRTLVYGSLTAILALAYKAKSHYVWPGLRRPPRGVGR
jgi:hypothetical protein